MPRPATNLQITVVGTAALLVFAGVVWFGFGPSLARETESSPVATAPIPPPSERITVHVSGAVSHAGLVEVVDGARIADAIAAAGGATFSADLGALNLAGLVRDGDHVTVPTSGPDDVTGVALPEGVDLNTSTSAQLQDLPGVGPVLAERIVAFRDENGHFETIEDLLDVPGIGEAKLEAMRSAIASP